MADNRKTYNILLTVLMFVALALQVALQTKYRNAWGFHANSIVWTLSGIIFLVCALFTTRKIPLPSIHYKYLTLLIGTIVMIYAISWAHIHLDYNFKRFPVKFDGSDVIPTIEILVKRFLNGEEVYSAIQFPHHTVIPTYFTTTWAPFIPAELYGWDYRWTPIVLFLGTILAMIYTAWWKTSNYTLWLLFVLFTAATFYGLARYDRSTIRFAVEFLPSCYYLILCVTLLSRNAYLVAIGILLCILSRYSLLLWIPLYVVITYFHRDWKFVLKTGLILFVGWCLIFFVPFFDFNPMRFFDTMKTYGNNAQYKWNAQSWQPEGAIPHTLTQGYGLAVFFYEAFVEDVVAGITAIRRVQLFSVVLVSLLTFLYYWKNRAKKIDLKLVMIISLNLYLLFFYAFLYAPYGYLFYVPLTSTLAVLWWLTVREG